MGCALARSRRGSVFSQSTQTGIGTRILQILLVLIVLGVIGFGVFVAVVDIAPPTRPVERSISPERFTE